MTPAVLSALPMHPAPLAPALAGLPATFTPSTTAVGGNVYLTAAVGLLLGDLRKAAFWQPGMCAGAFRSQKPLFAGVSLSASVRLHLVHVLPGA